MVTERYTVDSLTRTTRSHYKCHEPCKTSDYIYVHILLSYVSSVLFFLYPKYDFANTSYAISPQMYVVVTCKGNLFICIFPNSLPKPNPCKYKTLCGGPVDSYMKPAAISRLKGQAQGPSNKLKSIGAGRPAESRSGSSL